jgi:hypothetical protein
MFKRVFAVCIASTLGLATLPVEVSAKGFGSHSSHHALIRRHHHWLLGGFGAAYVGVLPSVPLQIDAVTSPSCSYSREIVTVPSEDGGTRQITITKCPQARDKVAR